MIFNKDNIVKITKVFIAKYTALLQLLYTVGGNQARLDVHTKFEILEHSLKGGVEAGHTHNWAVEAGREQNCSTD